jgi:group I intron endonuclease
MLVYRIISPSGKSYIGITKRTFVVRWKQHCKDARTKPHVKFHYAIRKYGEDAFVHEILEEVETRELASVLEKFYIEKFDSFINGYNMTTGGENNFELSEESKAKISKFHKGRKKSPQQVENMKKIKLTEDQKKKISENHADVSGENNPRFGVEVTQETRQKMSEKSKGHSRNKGTIRSEETRKLLSEIGKKRKPTEETRKLLSQNSHMKGKSGRDVHSSRYYKIYNKELGIELILCGTEMKQWCVDNNISYDSLYGTTKCNRPLLKGMGKGWQCDRLGRMK